MGFDKLSPNGVSKLNPFGLSLSKPSFPLSSRLEQSLGHCDIFGLPDVEPQPLMDRAEAAPRLDRPGPEQVGREGSVRMLALEQALRDHLDAAVDEGRHAMGLAALQGAGGAHVEIAAAAVAIGARMRDDEQQ